MSSSESTAASASSSMAGRSSKGSKTVVLKLPSALLSRWPGIAPSPSSDEKSEEKVKESASPSASSSTPLAPASDAGPASDATPAAAATEPEAAAPSAESPEGAKRKGVPGPKPGSKRGAPSDAQPKPRGKPGPKKKPRLEDGTIDHSAVAARAMNTAPHKLGPKANQGAINAGLRALDRTGKPTRKWERKTFNLKSFTGVVWDVPSWRAPPKPKPAEEGDAAAKSEETAPATNGDGDEKASSVTDKSGVGDTESTPFATNGFASPAAPVAAAS